MLKRLKLEMKPKKKKKDLQDVVHSVFQALCSSCSWGCSETQDLRQWTFSFQLLFHIASHNLVVDRFLVGVVALINYQQRNVCKEPPDGKWKILRL